MKKDYDSQSLENKLDSGFYFVYSVYNDMNSSTVKGVKLVVHRWRSIWFLARFEILRHGLGYIFSLLFFVYASGMVTLMLNDSDGAGQSGFSGSNIIIDLYFLYILGMCGLALASKRYWGYWRTKSFSKKAIFLKSFPISAREMIESKLLHMVIHVFVQGGLFFSMIIFVPSPIHQMLNTPQFLEFVLMWFGFAFVWGSIYVYLEISLSERTYLLVCIGVALLFTLVTLVGWLMNYPIVQHTMGWIRHYGAGATLISLGIGILFLYRIRALGIKKIHTRDLHL